ncbi:MAG: rhomboid family intramembrane serine protease [Oligoflexus sp.]|nr:rhomboid family intramembrane serine protease [Oligoflexus sp.]
MVTIPLGLGMRWPKMPVVTFAISAILILLFFIDYGQERSNNRTMHILSEPHFRLAKQKLFLEYCRSIKETPVNCAEVLAFVAPDYVKMEKEQKKREKDEDEREKKKNKDSKKPAKAAPKTKVAPAAPKLKKIEVKAVDRRHITQLYLKFEQEISHPTSSFRKLRSYRAFETAKALTTQRMLSTFRQEHILSKGNLRLDSVAFAQVRHAGWSHLFGNLLCLIPFGIYVELRMGALRYLLAYIAAGSLGLAFNTAFFLPMDMPLLGASANIAGVMGMFYVFFFHARMRFYLWFGLGQRLWVPVKYSLPAVFFISDITGAVQSLVPSHGGGGVAHFAHLGGLCTGMFVAWGLRLFHPLPTPFLYDDEPLAFKQMKAIPQLDKKIHMAQGMLAINLDNDLVRTATLEGILSHPTALKSVPENQAHAFLFANLDSHCALNIRLNKHFEAYRLIAATALHIPLAQYLGALGQSNHLILADFALSQKNHYLALRMYDAFLLRWTATAKAASIRLTVIEILQALPSDTKVGAALQDYALAYPHSALAREIGIKISMIQKDIYRHSPREDEYEPNRAG